MHINYLPLKFNLHFDHPIKPDTEPLFVFRSMIGKNLHEMCCAAKGTKCPECLFNKSCVYSFIFETILSQENDIHIGTNRLSHPFILSGGYYSKQKDIENYSFSIILLGKAIDYAKYIYKTIEEASCSGIFKDRCRFYIDSLIVNDKNVLETIENIDFNNEALSWKWDSEIDASNIKEILVELKTPLRFKTKGSYNSDFNAVDFFLCLYRRMTTLCSLYGENDNNEKLLIDQNIVLSEKHLKWEDATHYSARQKSAMKMGGFVGTLKLTGNFTSTELKLLEFSRIFSAGKNTNFGLGQFDYWTR